EFFDKVENEGGRASCQDNWETFSKMRRSQYMAWPEPLIESWKSDLVRANEEGRNPLTEKYGYMMCISDPEGNAETALRLPPVSPKKIDTARRIVDRLIPQNETFRAKYPRVSGRGRPLRTSEEPAAGWTSIETYELGELWTYSQKTLELFEANLDAFEKEGKSYPETVVENGLKLRGFKSLEEAEAILARG
ncbi:MAG: DUF4125 family protein, partial [Proteobacteria bacterium]|nr:DUF4125 family protein [Pseudomonadota bacterium]